MKLLIRLMRGPIQDIAYPCYFLGKILYRLFCGHRNITKMIQHGLRHRLHELDLRGYRNGTCLFVLATGASVNHYTYQQWRQISRHTSVGINFWILHDFIPSVYLTELLGPAIGSYFANLKRRQAELIGTPFIVKGNYCDCHHYRDLESEIRILPEACRDQFFLARDFAIPGDTPGNFARSLRWLQRVGFFRPSDRIGYVCQSRASISTAIVLGVKMGFKQIVLCGVDLNSTEYFYTTDRTKYLAKGLEVPETGQRGSQHMTNVSQGREMTIAETIYCLQDVLGPLAGLQIYVGSRSSALYPRLPSYAWEASFREHLTPAGRSVQTECSRDL